MNDLRSLGARIGLTGLLAIVAAIALIVAVKSCGSGRDAAEQGRQDTRSGEALAETAREAAATAIARAGEEASVDQLVAAATQEIENAPSDEAAGNAARAAICRLPDYRDDPACRVQ